MFNLIKNSTLKDTLFYKAFNFKTRASRIELLEFLGFQSIIYVALYIFYSLRAIAYGTENIMPSFDTISGIVIIILSIYLFLTNISLSVRRFHDAGYSGWRLLLLYILFFLSIVVIAYIAIFLPESFPYINTSLKIDYIYTILFFIPLYPSYLIIRIQYFEYDPNTNKYGPPSK